MVNAPDPAGELFHDMVANSSDAVLLLNAAGEIVSISERSERLLGYSIEERLGHSGFEMVHVDDQPHVRAAFGECLRRPRVAITAEFRNRHKDGSWRYIEAVAVNRLDEAAAGAIVGDYHAITGRHNAQKTLRLRERRP